VSKNLSLTAKIEVSVEMVDKWIHCMKKGNAAGIDGLTVEHLMHVFSSCSSSSYLYFLQGLCSIYQCSAGHDDAVSIIHSINL